MSGSVCVERTKDGQGVHLLSWENGRLRRYCDSSARILRAYTRYLMLPDIELSCPTCAARLIVLRRWWDERGIDGSSPPEGAA